jgi:putative ABC transport system permease protein
MALIGAEEFQRYWGDQGVHSLAILFEPGTPMHLMEEEQKNFIREFGGKEAFACYDNRTLRARIVEIFNQTFAVTAVLRTISIAVAVGGVMLTLGVLVLERTRDFGVLRSMGASSRQIIQMMLTEAAMIGLIASVMGLLSGSALALVLTWVINKVFFGWSIDLSYPWWDLVAVPFWMTAAALASGVVPAWHASQITPAAALRME